MAARTCRHRFDAGTAIRSVVGTATRSSSTRRISRRRATSGDRTKIFMRVGSDILEYEFSVDDPTTWTGPWKAMIPLKKKDELVYEYACHEGNDAIPDMLRGHRYEERHATKSGQK
jgi:hypothetical protein